MAKQTYGTMNGYGIELNQGALIDKKCTYLSEGVETGLSILNVKKDAHVMAVLGASNFKNIRPEYLADQVIICLDNDFKTQATQKQIESIKHCMAKFKAMVERLNRAGKQVKFALPNHAGFDFNDVLKQQVYVEFSKQVNQLIALKDYQKITDNYIENNLQKSIDNENNQTISFKEKSIVFTDHSSDHILKNNS